MKPELLSPAGSMEAFKAALAAGADAIYIGGKQFGARAFSPNFALEEIEYAITLAHLYDVKVYVTLNTLIYDDEVESFIDYVKKLANIGVDAVIMQDMGMIDLVRKTIPSLEIHVSTQAHIHNLYGVKLLESLGIKRTVLARETSIEEIENISKNSNIDLEIFIAGALCISYSGNCLMSSLIGGRSGNRGMCAGTCRLPYDLVDSKGNILSKDKYILSTKDLNTLENIGKLIDLGIKSFKIEGRMKSPEYVYVITSLYRKAIDSYLDTGKVLIDDNLLLNLRKVFTRGFTKGFIFNEDNNNLVNTKMPNHNGIDLGKVINYKKGLATIKLTDDLSINDGIRFLDSGEGFIVTSIYKDNKSVKNASKGDTITLKVDDFVSKDSKVLKTKDTKVIEDISSMIKLNKRKVKIDMYFKATSSSMELEVVKDDFKVKVSSNNIEKAKNISTTKEDIISKLSKLGDTPYTIDNIKIDLEDNLFINIKDINALRRETIDKLNILRLAKKEVIYGTYSIDVKDYKTEANTNYKVANIDIYNKLKDYKDIYVEDINLHNKIDSIYILPRVVSKYEDVKNVEVSELGGLYYYKDAVTSPYMNAVNSYTVAFYHSLGASRVTLSYEMDYTRIKSLVESYHKRYDKHPNLEVITYGSIEAMISKFNVLKYHNLEGNYYLKDRKGSLYPIRIKDGKMVIEYSDYVNDDNNYFEIGVNNIRIDLTNLNDLKLIQKK